MSNAMSVCFIASCRMILHKVDLKHFKLLAWYRFDSAVMRYEKVLMMHGIYICDVRTVRRCMLEANIVSKSTALDESTHFFWYVTAHTARVTRKWCLRICALYTASRPFRPSNTTSKSFSPPPSPPLHHFQNHAYTRFCVFRHGWYSTHSPRDTKNHLRWKIHNE